MEQEYKDGRFDLPQLTLTPLPRRLLLHVGVLRSKIRGNLIHGGTFIKTRAVIGFVEEKQAFLLICQALPICHCFRLRGSSLDCLTRDLPRG